MGTNYYWKWNPCSCCGLSKEELHIGKSSGGWAFSLHVANPEKLWEKEQGLPETLAGWIALFTANDDAGGIYDEYGYKIGFNELMDTIGRRPPIPKENWGNQRMDKYSVFDPNIGLWRHTYNAKIVKGETFDLCYGEFS